MLKQSPLFIKLAFLLSFIYWFFLACSSQMILLHDSIGYESLGRLISQQGWIEYFKTGPNREPLYPFLIALSMKMGDFFKISYQSIQIIIQIILLLLTQLFAFQILKLLKIQNVIIALTIFYLGISPALINSTFCLFSEISIFPFLPAIVLMTYRSLICLISIKSIQKNILNAIVLGMLLLLATLTKAVFEMITPVIYFLFFLIFICMKKQSYFRQALIFLMISAAVYYIPLSAYKYLNLKYNGNFTLTDRGSWALYGNTERRMQPLTAKRFLTAVSYIGGHGFCRQFFNDQECTEWSYVASDNFGAKKRQELQSRGYSDQKLNNELIKLSVQKTCSNLPQYFILWIIEGMKMLVWESVAMAYVLLSNSLLKIYNYIPLQLVVFFSMPLAISASLIQTCCFVALRWKKYKASLNNNPEILILLIILILLSLYISFYSFFFILARYAFPLASLYVILIAFSLNSLSSFFAKKKPDGNSNQAQKIQK